MALVNPLPVQDTPVRPTAAPPMVPTVLEDSDDDSHTLALPMPDPDDSPHPRTWYPKPWQQFIDHAQCHILYYMMFVDPFPPGPYSQIMVREEVAAAFNTFYDVHGIFLDPDSCKFTHLQLDADIKIPSLH